MRNMTYTKAIKRIREMHELTQTEFAEKLGKKQATISSWESGRTKPSAADLIEINRIFGTDIKPQYDYIAYSEAFGGALDAAARGDHATMERAEYVIEKSGNRSADIRLLTYLDALNPAGVREALKRVAELTEIPRYRRGVENGNGEKEGQ